jgi:hypothetical protein
MHDDETYWYSFSPVIELEVGWPHPAHAQLWCRHTRFSPRLRTGNVGVHTIPREAASEPERINVSVCLKASKKVPSPNELERTYRYVQTKKREYTVKLYCCCCLRDRSKKNKALSAVTQGIRAPQTAPLEKEPYETYTRNVARLYALHHLSALYSYVCCPLAAEQLISWQPPLDPIPWSIYY